MSVKEEPGVKGEFKEFKLVSAGPTLAHHIMKVNHDKFDFVDLTDPVRLVRQDVLDKARAAREAVAAAALEQDAAANPNAPQMTADPSQIAPFGQPKPKVNAFKRKSKSYTKARDEGKRVRDPDRFPWVLTDFDESHAYTGALQGEASSNFALFVFSEDGFKVIPVSKNYKFNLKPKHRILSTDEAEERMRQGGTHRPTDRWMMHQKEDGGTAAPALPASKGKKDVKDGKDMKDWKKKLLNGESSSGDHKSSSNSMGAENQKSKVKREEFEELDYDEEFADDEVVDLGIEDKEEAKEASKRQYGRAGTKSFFGGDQSDYDEDEGDKPTSIEKALTKALHKFDRNDAYENDEENPYISDNEDDDEFSERIKDEPKEALKLDDFVTASTKPRRLSPGPGIGDAETALKRLQTLSGRAPSPDVKRERSASPEVSDSEARPNVSARSPSSSGTASPTGNEKKRRRVDEPVMPPPPTASQVIARELEKERMKKRKSFSPPPQSRPEYSPSNSPSPGPSSSSTTGGDLLMDDDVIRILKSRSGPITVKEIVAQLKSFLVSDSRNKDRIRGIIKKVLNHDKASGCVTLKKEYENWRDPAL